MVRNFVIYKFAVVCDSQSKYDLLYSLHLCIKQWYFDLVYSSYYYTLQELVFYTIQPKYVQVKQQHKVYISKSFK
jgi:hypothetical protein